MILTVRLISWSPCPCICTCLFLLFVLVFTILLAFVLVLLVIEVEKLFARVRRVTFERLIWLCDFGVLDGMQCLMVCFSVCWSHTSVSSFIPHLVLLQPLNCTNLQYQQHCEPEENNVKGEGRGTGEGRVAVTLTLFRDAAGSLGFNIMGGLTVRERERERERERCSCAYVHGSL